MIKSLVKVGMKTMYLNIIKAIHDKPTTNIILNSEKLKTFPLKLGTTHVCSLLPLFSTIVLEFLGKLGKKKK